MGITPESAYGVEDSYNGMRSLHAAGLHPIMVPDLLEPNEANAKSCRNNFARSA